MKKAHWIHDYETLCNCFVAVFEHYKTSERKVYVIHDLQNDFKEFFKFLETNKENKEWHISYNGLAFDAQVTHYIMNNSQIWENMSGCAIAEAIYAFAQETIARQNRKEWGILCTMAYTVIGQIDLFKMHHWDNPAKLSSLKWIQYQYGLGKLCKTCLLSILYTRLRRGNSLDTDQLDTALMMLTSTKAIFDNRSKSQIKLAQGVNMVSMVLTYTVHLNLVLLKSCSLTI